jgi:GH15 family glucan-1,4-alpha-glucosidase
MEYICPSLPLALEMNMRFATRFLAATLTLAVSFGATIQKSQGSEPSAPVDASGPEAAPASAIPANGAPAKTTPATQSAKLTPLVTGNGFGYAVLSPSGEITRLYAHPYRFERPNPDFSKDGFSTTNLIKSLSWTESGQAQKVQYLKESQIMVAQASESEQLFFMPFGLERNALIAVLRAPVRRPETLKIDWLHAIKQEENKTAAGRTVRSIEFKNIKESVVLVPLEAGAPAPSSSHSLPGNSWAILVIDSPHELAHAVKDVVQWQDGVTKDGLVQREISRLEKWRKTPPCHFASKNERHLWRQNETILRMAQIQEPNIPGRFSHGLILASLPDGVWFTPWVRDMAYSVVGLVKMGHLAEAREGILAYFNARPMGRWRHETRGADYQISVTRYFGDGSEEADYSGQLTPNVEFDDWGLALWAVSEYFQTTHDIAFLSTPTYRGPLYKSMRDYVVKSLLANMDKWGDGLIVTKDSSLWEEHQQNKRHYAFTTVAAINGLRGFEKMAIAMHDPDTAQTVSKTVDQLEKGFKMAFVRDGALTGTPEDSSKHVIDGSLIEAFNFNVITDPTIRQKTLEKMELLKTSSGGYKRLLGGSDYEKQEFAFVNFYLARLYFKLGKMDDGNRILERMVAKSCHDNGLIAECYVSEKSPDFPGEIGQATGSIPMVGYGAGAYALTLSEREKSAKIQNAVAREKHE